MARSYLRHTVKDRGGSVIQNALVNVYTKGTTTAVIDLFAAETGGSAITTLTSNSQGEVEGWLTTPKFVDLNVTDNTDAAYYASAPTVPISFTTFTETVEVMPRPEEISLTTHTHAYEPAGSVAAHEADTTNIHGIVDTAQLATLNTAQTFTAAKTFQAAGAATAVAGVRVAGDGFDRIQIQPSQMLFGDGTVAPAFVLARNYHSMGGGALGSRPFSSGAGSWIYNNTDLVFDTISGDVYFNRQNATIADITAAGMRALARTSGTVGFTVKGAASQTANLQEFQNSAGTPGMVVDSGRLLKWLDATLQQTTVGAAGGASALPATPTKYLQVRDSAGTLLVVPAYAAA